MPSNENPALSEPPLTQRNLVDQLNLIYRPGGVEADGPSKPAEMVLAFARQKPLTSKPLELRGTEADASLFQLRR
jgi:hypothetical protein